MENVDMRIPFMGKEQVRVPETQFYLVLEEYDDQAAQVITREVLLPYLNEIFADLFQRQQIND